MSSFHAILTKEAKRIVLKQYFNVLTFLYTLLHHLRGTQERLTYNQIDFLGKARQIEGVFTSRIATTHNGHSFLTIEETITGSTSTYTLTVILTFVIQS